MGFFDRFRKNKVRHSSPEGVANAGASPDSGAPLAAPAPLKVDFERATSPEEREIVAVIASAIAAGSHPDSSFRVKSVTGIDTDKEVAAAIVAAIASGDHPDSHFRLVNITEIQS